ncbi:MAG: hypothetical protein ACRDP6_10585 [Actinoallomurus sp.]
MAASDPDGHHEAPASDSADDGLWPVYSGQGPLPAAGVAVLLASGAFPGRTAVETRARTVRDRWRRVAARLVERNARILVLRNAAEAVHRRDIVTTELLVPADMSLREIDSWVVGVDRQLALARDELGGALAREALRRLTDRRPPVDPHLLAMATRLAADDRSGRGGRIRGRLAKLDPENTPDRFAQALEVAARAAVTRSPVASQTYADQLSSIVRAGNAETGRRREELMIAAGYLQAIEAAPCSHPWRDWLIDRLDSVLTGGLGLPDDVQDAAERLRSQIEESAEHSYLTRLLRGHLTGLGFTVLVSAAESGDVSLYVRDGGRLLLRGGLVTAGPPVGGAPPSPAFTRALDALAPLLGTSPAWDPAAFEVPYANAACHETP